MERRGKGSLDENSGKSWNVEPGGEQAEHGQRSLEGNRKKSSSGAWRGTDRGKSWKVDPGVVQTEESHGKWSQEGNQ